MNKILESVYSMDMYTKVLVIIVIAIAAGIVMFIIKKTIKLAIVVAVIALLLSTTSFSIADLKAKAMYGLDKAKSSYENVIVPMGKELIDEDKPSNTAE